jgi:transcriptional regulator with XRE-family HTH domain
MATVIKVERVKQDLTLTQLAEKAGSNRNRIHNLERGLKANQQDMIGLSAALGMAVQTLFTDDGFPRMAA